MHAAPACALTLRVGRSERTAMLLLVALAAASLGAWAMQLLAAQSWLGAWPWPRGAMEALGAGIAAPIALLVSAPSLARHCRPVVPLAWTGAIWTWAQRPALVTVALDLGPWLLLRAELLTVDESPDWRQPADGLPAHGLTDGPGPGTPLRWRPMARWRCAPAEWHAMRVALQAHAHPLGAPAARSAASPAAGARVDESVRAARPEAARVLRDDH